MPMSTSSTYQIDVIAPLYEDPQDPSPPENSGVMRDMGINSSYEALRASLNRAENRGKIDLDYMSALSGIPVDKLISDLRGKAMIQDAGLFHGDRKWDCKKGWILIPQYIQGIIRDKLNIAKLCNKKFEGCFDENIRLLTEHLPDVVPYEDIKKSLGVNWIPKSYYAKFIKELLRLKKEPKIVYVYNQGISEWKIICAYEPGSSVLNSYTYGTTDLSAVKIIELTMNSRTVKVYDTKVDSLTLKKERILNRAATLAVQEKQRIIIKKFDEWLSAEPERKQILEERYNELFTGYAFSPYDGSFLSLPDINPEITLFSHQKDAIARILFSDRNIILAHDVGTGKTFEMVVSAHELKRLGLSNKNLIVVPNNVLGDVVDAHRKLYPNDNILAVFPKDFTGAKRNKVLTTIMHGDFVAIYMAYSSFELITMSKAHYVKKYQDEIDTLKKAAANSKDRYEKHMLDIKIESLSRKLSKYILEQEDGPWIPYDKLGIETIYVDEAHSFKNIPLDTKTDGITGLHTAGSKKCAEMLEKCSVTKRIIFATGTPLPNSLADLYVHMTYLQKEDLKFHEIDAFDMWINCFGERCNELEIDVDGSGIRPMTRFATFHNLTELMSLFSNVCDFHYVEADKAELPKFSDYIDVVVPKGPAQKKYLKKIIERTELVRAHKIKRTEDNLLKIAGDGRACALDIRLVVSEGITREDIECSKVHYCAQKVWEIYNKYPDTCQMIFSDIGTPKTEFNVYDALREELENIGVKPQEIVYAHDIKNDTMRKRINADVNKGKIRVIIGSTDKLGVGVNMQERLIAMHHLDVPWRPSDMTQREGRIKRRGNTCEEIFIFRYVTQGSFDSYSWQLLQNKQRFINSFLSGTSTVRDIEDISETLLSYAEIKALAIGNPLIRDRVNTANRLERAKISNRQRIKQLSELKKVIENTPSAIESFERRIENVKKDRKHYKKMKTTIPNSERIAFGEELAEGLKTNVLAESERVFSDYQGFDVILPANMLSDKPYIYLSHDDSRHYIEMDVDTAMGYSKRLDYYLEHLNDIITECKGKVRMALKNEQDAKNEIEIGNLFTSQIEILERELEDLDEQIENIKEAV